MIIVDELREYPEEMVNEKAQRHGLRWCHLVSDESFDELHEFANFLGLSESWFQRDHYDLTPGKRAAAVALGAEELTGREMIRRRVRVCKCRQCGRESVRNFLTPCPGCGEPSVGRRDR